MFTAMGANNTQIPMDDNVKSEKYSRLVELYNSLNKYPYNASEAEEYERLAEELSNAGVENDNFLLSQGDFNKYIESRQKVIPKKDTTSTTTTDTTSTTTTDTTSGANLGNSGNGAAGATNVAASAEGAGSAPLREEQNASPLKPTTETTEQTTKVKKPVETPAAQQAAANAALQGAGQPAQSAQPAQPAEESSWRQPIRDIADIDARFTRMLEDDAKADREREEKRINRQLAARSLSDLGGVFTDMIKASEGALVSPRQVEQHYQRLDDRQKQLYDTYRARMDAIRRGKLNRDAQRAKDEGDKAFQEEMLKRRLKAAADEGDAKRKNALKAAYIRRDYNGSNKPKYSLKFGDNAPIEYNEADGRRVYGQVLQYMMDKGYIPEDVLPKDKNGDFRMPNNEQVRVLVNYYFPTIGNYDLGELYKLVTGNTQDFRDPLTRNVMDTYPQGAQPSYREQNLRIGGWQNQPQQGQPSWAWSPRRTSGASNTSSGSLY